MQNLAGEVSFQKVSELQSFMATNPKWQQRLMAAKSETEFIELVANYGQQINLNLEDVTAVLLARQAGRQMNFELAVEQMVAVADRAPQRSGNTGSCGTSNCPTGGNTHGCKK